MVDKTKILLPVGRLVQGHPMLAQKQFEDDGKTPKRDKLGNEVFSYFMALAFSKEPVKDATGAVVAPQGLFLRDVWPAFYAAAQQGWPSGQFNLPTFAWKFIDGDNSFDKNGKPNKDKPGFAGCHVLRISSNYPYQVVDHTGARIITNPQEIKKGYYLRAHVEVFGNGPVNQSPGLYVNPSFAQLMAFGEEIISGPDVGAILAQAAGQQVYMPAGASSVPLTPTAPPPAGVPAVPGAPAAAPALPAVPGVPVGAPALPAVPGAPVAPPALPSMPVAAVAPIPGVPVVPAVPVVAPFPPAGWVPHPTAPGYFHNGVQAVTEQQLRAMVVPNTGILTPGI